MIVFHVFKKHLVLSIKPMPSDYLDLELGIRLWQDLSINGRYGFTFNLIFIKFIVSIENCK